MTHLGNVHRPELLRGSDRHSGRAAAEWTGPTRDCERNEPLIPEQLVWAYPAWFWGSWFADWFGGVRALHQHLRRCGVSNSCFRPAGAGAGAWARLANHH